ncbi:hypothetical protein Clacol_004751 [Clathrus columnatus]|uniref:Acid phosphatase n=1 Tax=Clathrus columnatus TaxID=1419009 RepID=A0AAV5AF00_9AGAM|nr:hypothetical protein Clacol_004751 [Clathrus columnatus]
MQISLLSALLPILNYLPGLLQIKKPSVLMHTTADQHESALDVENYPVAPPELNLEQVHIYIRHGLSRIIFFNYSEILNLDILGERAPVGQRLTSKAAGLPEHWLMCKAGRAMRALAVETATGKGSAHIGAGVVIDSNLIPETNNDVNVNFDPHRVLSHVRRAVERKDGTTEEGEWLKFLPSILYNEDTAYFRNAKDENILGNMYACRRLELMNLAFAQAAADVFNPLLAELDPKVSKYIGGPLRILRAAKAHNIKIPGAFEDKNVLDLLERSVVYEWFEGYKYHEFRRLAMGRLLDDLQRKMSHKAVFGAKDPLKILIHSTHDTALAGLCATLDVFDHRWPPFTAAITFELFSSSYPKTASNSEITNLSILSPFTSLFAGFSVNHIPNIFASTATPQPKFQYFIRMRYQNRTLPLPICAEHGKHLEGYPEFCTLEAFKEAVEDLIPYDFEAECLADNFTELGNKSVHSPSSGKAQASAAADSNGGS